MEKMIADKSASLASTPAADYPSYKERVGIIKGLQLAMKEAADLEATLGRSENTQGKNASNPVQQRYES